MSKVKSKPMDETARRVSECLRQSFNFVNADPYGDGSPFAKAERAEKLYRRIIDADNWIPQSEVFLPFAHAVIDTAVPNAVNYIFTQEDLFRVMPVHRPVQPDTLDLIEQYLEWDVQHVMNLRFASAPTIQDAFKLGVGYGMIEYCTVTPRQWEKARIFGERTRRVRRLGQPEYRLRYQHLPFGTVFPSPQGDGTPNGQEFVIVIRFRNIDELKRLQELETDEGGFVSDIDWEMIREDAINRKITQDYSGAFAFARSLVKLGERLNLGIPSIGVDYKNRKVPVQIPVVEMYSRTEHIWVANGLHTIYHVESEDGDDMFNPLVKAQISPNDGTWFAPGMLEKNFDVFDGTNMLFNAMLDSLDWQLRPRFLRDMSVISGDLNMEPYGQTLASGDVSKALQRIEPGGFAEGSMAAMQILQNARNVGTGQVEQLQGGATPGLVRGGMAAFESLLQTSTARDTFASELIAYGFFNDVLWKTLQMEQLLIGQRARRFTQAPEGAPNREYKILTITEDDLRHNLEIRLVLQERLKNTIADRQLRLNSLQLLFQIPALAREIDPQHAIAYILGGKDEARKLIQNANPQAYDNVMRQYQGKAGEAAGGEGGMPGMGGAAQGMLEGGVA